MPPSGMGIHKKEIIRTSLSKASNKAKDKNSGNVYTSDKGKAKDKLKTGIKKTACRSIAVFLFHI